MKLFYLFLAFQLCNVAASAQSKSPNKVDTTATGTNPRPNSFDVGAVHKTGDETVTGKKTMSYIDADTLHFTDLSPLNFGSILKDGSYSRFRWSQPTSGLSRHVLSLNTSADNILWNAKYRFSGHPQEGLAVQGRIDINDYNDPALGLIRGTLKTSVFFISGMVNSMARPVSAGLSSYYFFTDSATNNLIISQNNKELGLKFSNISRNRQFTFPDTTGTLMTGLGTHSFMPKWSGPNTLTNAIAGVDYVIPDTLLNYVHLTTKQNITGSKTFRGLTKIDSLDFSSTGNYQYIKTGNASQFHRWRKDNNGTAFHLESTRDAGTTWVPGFSQSFSSDEIPTNTLANLIANGYLRIANKEHVEITGPTSSNFVLVLDTASNLNIRRIPVSTFATDINVVHIKGDETIAGIKTFSASPIVPNATNSNQVPNLGQLNAGLDLKADKAITVNGQPLSANVTLAKADVGLSNADNTSDINKPVSIAAQTALDLKADKSITVNGQPLSANVTLLKADVGLSNADNTSDANKPVSIAAQTAFDLKADKSITVNGQPLSANVTLLKADVGLSNADNTSDANKPVSVAGQTALDLKADKTITVNGQPLSTNVILHKSDVGLSNADNTSDVNKPVSIAAQTALDLKADKSITVNGQSLSANVTLVKSDVGLANVDNTNDLNKPVSIATQSALNIKADKATTLAGYGITDAAIDASVVHNVGNESVAGIKTFSASPVIPDATTANQAASLGQVSGYLNTKADKSITVNGQPLSANVSITKDNIGLGFVNNTSDADKPVSTATQSALNIKADKATTLAGYGITDAVINSTVVHIYGDESISGVKVFNGNVGIGTSNPGAYQLAVKGTIKTQAIKVDPSNWADYVFAKSYKLPALSEVEKFIQDKQHLPDIPSEADVKKNGIELGEMNALLLKKIEELTLYMIQKDKEVTELKSRLDKLERR